MKISNLTEMATPSSMPDNNTSAPKFGRSDEMLESGVGTTTSGSVATDAKPMGKMRTRGQGSMFKGISTSSKYANSRKAGISEDSVNEDELSEEQLQAKKRREENFKKAKDRELGNKPQSRDIMTKEEFNGEYDDEAGMFKNNLQTIQRVSTHLEQAIADNENLPEWCQEKIGVAKAMVVTVMDYMISQHENGERPTVDEAGPGIPFRGVGGAFNRGDDERHDLDTPKPTAPQVWGLKINGKVWSKAGKSVTFTSKEAALKSRDSILKTRPDLEIGLVTRGGQQGVTESSQRVDSLVTDALKIMRGSGLNDAVQALKTVLGDREYNERRGHYNFYVKQILDMYGQQGVAEGEGNKYGSQENWDSLRKDIRSQYPYKKGTTVTVPHKGKLVNGKIVRYDAGGGGYSPAYVVDIGEYESIMVPPNKVRQGVAEGWKERLGAAALTGAMALGAAGASADTRRVTPDGQGGFTGGFKPSATVAAPADNKPAAEAPKGFSKEYLQKAADPNRFGRYMISVEKAQELLKGMQEGVAEESKGLWANIHAKRERIKNGSGEKMRKPGSTGAPTASALRKSAT